MALCLVAYLSVSTFGMAAARAERDHQLDGRALAGDTGPAIRSGTPRYIGLGYLPNDWNIRFYDGVGLPRRAARGPKATYLGPAYGRILRDRYFKLVSENPVYAFRNYAEKLTVAMRPAWFALLGLAVAGPWLLLVTARRGRWRRDALFVAIAGLVGLVSPLLATPTRAISWGGWRRSCWPESWREPPCWRRGVRSRASARSRGRAERPRQHRSVVAISAASIAVILLCVATGPAIHDSALRWLNSAPTPQVVQPPDATH